jgi:penicillin amidase
MRIHALSRLLRCSAVLSLVASAPLTAACGDDDKPAPADTSADVAADISLDDTGADTGDDVSEPADTAPDVTADTSGPEYEKPGFFPTTDAADEVLLFEGFSQPVRVVYDDRGIPHIYAANATDLARAQGYVTARDRIFQMHTLRSAAKGRLAEFSGVGALSGDMFLRTLKLGRVAEEMAANTEANDPLTWPLLSAFTDGVNAYLANLRAGREKAPTEIIVFGTQMIYDWTPADTMAIVRLQTWDLGFGGIVNELSLLEYIQRLRAEHEGTPLADIWKDIVNFSPAGRTPTIVPEGGIPTEGNIDIGDIIDQPFFRDLEAAHIVEVRKGLEAMEFIPHRAFRAAGEMYGSNNWVVSGAHTTHGKAIVANDTHLSLRNPAIFYQVHLDTTRAGGDISLNGVNFAGAPGIVLGHNDHIAWGATVVYSDTTDYYVERFVPADEANGFGRYDRVYQNGDIAVAVQKRQESFVFNKPSGGECVDAAPAWVKNLEWSQVNEGGVCTLTVTMLDVPNHGPIVPWSFREKEDGTFVAMSWKWTGFEVTEELGAVTRINLAKNWDEFRQALDYFSVGSQNWVYGDKQGNIGWFPSHRVPIRKNIAAGDTRFPPFLPMPGDTGEAEWTGFVPRTELPQAYNPPSGYLITANADPMGISYDNDPFNDGIYFGYVFDIGYRMDQIDRRFRAVIDGGQKFDHQVMASIQGDHRSRFGEALTPALLRAVAAAREGSNAAAAVHLDAMTEAAADRLALWEDLDFEAASGVGAEGGSPAQKAATATAIFNAWLRFMIENTIFDEGLQGLGGSMTGRYLARVFAALDAWEASGGTGEKPAILRVFDDITTEATVETHTEILVKSLKQAVAFLADPATVGPRNAGGFGTDDMDAWRWGALHTVTLRHNVSTAFDIPSPSVLPNGFPRPGDVFGVDASDPGLFGRTFTYAHGAAIRNVYDMVDPVVFHGVIPGGQSENTTSPFYKDGAESWSRNEAPLVAFQVTDVVARKTRVVDMIAPVE